MKDKRHEIEQLWSREAYCHWTGRRWLIDRTEEIPRIIVPLDCLVEDIASSKEDQFSIRKGRHGGLVVHASPLGKRILDCAKYLDTNLVRQCLPRHSFSPYFELWESQREAIFELALGTPSPSAISWLNAWLASMRTHARFSPFHDVMKKRERAALKNALSTREFVHDVRRCHSRLLAVRVDAGYCNDPMDVGGNWVPPPDAQVKEHLSAQIRFFQRQVEPLVGYIWKVEYGAAKGHHCHFMLLLDGHKAREGITWGNVVGNHWLEVTSRLGSYWNCNADMATYLRRGLLGIGLINYDDLDGQRNLMRTAMYLAKVDYYARFESPEFARTFGKSEAKGEPSGRGRPRKYASEVEQSQKEQTGPRDTTSMAIDAIRRGSLRESRAPWPALHQAVPSKLGKT